MFPSDAEMDSKMFKVERNTAIPGGIDADLLASFSSIVVFAVAVKFAILWSPLAMASLREFPLSSLPGPD